MKKTRYIFGYLFVRISKALAIVALLATGVSVVFLWKNYGLKASNLAYHKTSSLDLQCRQLEEELEYAKREVSRIGSVGDLPALKLSGDCGDSEDFVVLLGELGAANQRQAVLKQRVTDGFAARSELLRSKISNVIASIEASRAVTKPDVESQNNTTSTTIPHIASAPSPPGQQKTVFDSLDPDRLDMMLGTFNNVGLFLDQLANKAEKEENKKLILDAKASLNDLSAWLPRIQLDPRRSVSDGIPSSSRSATDSTARGDGPPPDPLTTARNNYEMLGRAIEIVRSEIGRGWRVERMLMETTQMAESEAQKCRSSENGLQMLRLEYASQAGINLLIGLVAAFLILVFADFLQSFFDTASSSASILEFLERNSRG